QYGGVRLGEYLGQFHADGREVVDVEEPPVVDFLGRHAPERWAVRLRVDERVEPVERPRVARRAVVQDQASFQCGPDLGAAFHQSGQAAADALLFAVALG